MIIKFAPEFIKYTSFKDTIEIQGSNVGSVLEKLLNDYPQLYVFLVDKNGEESSKTSFKLNGKYIFDPSSLYIQVGLEDVLEFGRDVPTGENAVGRIIAGVLLAVVNFAFLGDNPYIYTFAASLALGGVADLVVGNPSLPTFDSGNNTSATYTFSGIKNTTVLGTPVGIVYGRHRVGGHILNVYNDVIGTDATGNTSWLRMQLGLCEGEINKIEPDSIEINNRSSSAFPKSDIEVTCRYGNQYQTPPENKLIVANDATSEITPATGTSTINTTGWEHTLETAASSVEVYINGTQGSGLYTNTFKIYYKLASSTNDYIECVGPYKQSAGHYIEGYVKSYTVNFKTAGIYKIKIVEIYTTSSQYASGKLYVEKYVIHNSGSTNTDVNAAMENFNLVENSTTYTLLINNDPDGVVDITSPGTVVTTSAEVDKLKVNLSAPVLYASSNGSLVETSVTIKLYWKKNTDVAYTETNSVTATLKDKTKSEVPYSVVIPIIDYAVYDVKAVRVTPSNENNLLIQDRVYLKDLVEIVQESLIYPHTALLGLSIKATEYISGGLPTVTSIIQGTKVLVPENYNPTRRYMSGSFTGNFQTEKQWTDNPVWCLYDLITNSRYGLKDYFKLSPSKMGVMKANFYLMAQYCDTRLLEDGTVVTDPTASNYEQARPRFSLNIVIDQSKSAIEWLTLICATMRATLYYTEGLVFIDIDRPKPITQIFNMSNIKEFTEAGSSFKQLPNVYEVQFNNKDKDYDQDTLLLEDPSYQLDLTIEEYKKTLQLMGVTEEQQAKALAKYTLRVGQLLTTTVNFKTSTYGLLSTVGDVVGVQHDVPQWGYGGNVKSYNQTTKVITLSNEVEIKSGISYSIQLVHKGQVPEIVAITEPVPGIYTQLTLTNAPVNVPTKGDYYIVGETTNIVKPFKIVSLKRDKDEVMEVTCVEYNEQVYTYADNISDLPVLDMPQYSQLEIAKRESVTNVVVEQRVYTDSNSATRIGIDVYYTVPSSNLFWKGVVVQYGLQGSDIYTKVPIDTTGHVFIPEIPNVEGTYQFVLTSVWKDGTSQTVTECLSDFVNTPYATLQVTPFIPNIYFIQGVSGLEIAGQGNDLTFIGKEVTVRWLEPKVVDQQVVSYVENTVNRADSNSWLSFYLVEFLNLNGSNRRAFKTRERTASYLFHQNKEDSLRLGEYGAARSFTVRITAVDRLGRPSTPVSITVSNAAPVAAV